VYSTRDINFNISVSIYLNHKPLLQQKDTVSNLFNLVNIQFIILIYISLTFKITSLTICQSQTENSFRSLKTIYVKNYFWRKNM